LLGDFLAQFPQSREIIASVRRKDRPVARGVCVLRLHAIPWSVVLLNTLTTGTVSFTSSPPRTYMGDGFTNT
jgi:hypothetical protein